MTEYSNQTLTELLKSLEKQIESGFKGVHDRQDTTNGRIGKLEDRTGQLEIWRGVITGGLIILSGVIGYVFQLIK